MWSGIVKFFVNFILPSIIENLVLTAERNFIGKNLGEYRKSFVTNEINLYLIKKGWDKYFNTSEISDLIDKKVSKVINV